MQMNNDKDRRKKNIVLSGKGGNDLIVRRVGVVGVFVCVCVRIAMVVVGMCLLTTLSLLFAHPPRPKDEEEFCNC